MSVSTIKMESKLWENVTSKIVATSTEGTLSQYKAIKTGGSVYIAFVFTTSVSKTTGQVYTIKLTFSDSKLRPIVRSCNGGSNSNIGNVNINPATDTTAEIYAYTSAAYNAGAAFWATVTYACAGA